MHSIACHQGIQVTRWQRKQLNRLQWWHHKFLVRRWQLWHHNADDIINHWTKIHLSCLQCQFLVLSYLKQCYNRRNKFVVKNYKLRQITKCYIHKYSASSAVIYWIVIFISDCNMHLFTLIIFLAYCIYVNHIVYTTV